ncbi:hypothetical protein Pan161_17630 [Gimesia algae]|uniref:Uncharacterized protein n=1 Tax=Gimesia algae TaxID=2527971 RepID=A0A517VAU9_9PLAN|nr:hypothetical protein Pan161_17630 [Gimesia algae]
MNVFEGLKLGLSSKNESDVLDLLSGASFFTHMTCCVGRIILRDGKTVRPSIFTKKNGE